jgi:hypothetical protein
MTVHNNFAYPHPSLFQALHDFYSEMNGPASFEPSRAWEAGHWSARVECSRGSVLKKAGFCRLDIAGGRINENPGSLTLLQTLAYPENPRIPGFIIMTNTNETEAAGRVLVFYCDLFLQNAENHEQAKKFFAETLQQVCTRHGHDFMAYNQFLAGKRLLGNNTAECGLLYFFEEKDRLLLEELIRQALQAYRSVLERGRGAQPAGADFESMHRLRARLIEWINMDDYGVKVARENGIPLEVIEAYAFPPEISY